MADGVAIDTTATTSFTVTSAEVGKKISVKVTGDNGSEATSAETAAVEAPASEELAITEATQTAASDFTVKFNQKVDATNFTFEVKRGATAQTITTAISDDQLSAVITLATAIGAADYDITVTPKDTTKKPATATVKGEVSELKDIIFASDKLVLTSANGTTGAVIIKGVDQFDAEVTFTKSNLKLYSSVSTDVEYNADTKQVTVTAPTQLPLTQGSQVTVSLVYTKGTTVIQKTATLTVSAVAYVAEGSFGELATSNSKLVGKRVTLKNFADDSYYVPFDAKDQYGNELTAKQLEQMKTNNLLFITPSADMTSYYAYFYKFDTVDKKPVIRFKHGATTPGTVQINVVSVGGNPIAGSFVIEDNPFIDSLDVSVPELYKGSDAEFVLTAKDQYGDAIDLWDFESDIARTDSQGNPSTTTIQMGDKNNLTKSGTQLAVSSGAIKFVKDSIKKTIKIMYTPAGGTTSTDTLTVTTATPTVSTQQLTINDQGIPGGVRMSGTAVTSLTQGQSFSFKKNLEFLDNYGAVMKSNLNANTPVFTATATATITAANANRTTCGGDYIWTITTDTTGSAKFVANATTTDDATDYKPAGNTTATQDFGITIYGPALKQDGTPETSGYRVIKSETFTLNSVKDDDVKYTASIKDDKVLHVGASVTNTTPSVTVLLSATDANGKPTTVSQSLINKIDAGKFVLNGNNIVYDSTYAKGLTAAGSQEVKVYVDGVAAPLTATLNYDVAASTATTYKFTDSTGKSIDADITSSCTLNINTKAPDTATANGQLYTWALDQYGDQMTGLKLTKVADGSEVPDGPIGTGLPAYALRYNDSEVIQVAAGANVTIAGAAAATAAVKTVTWGGAELTFGVVGTTTETTLATHKVTIKDSTNVAQTLTNDYRVVIKNSTGKEEINTTGANTVNATPASDGLKYDGANKTITSDGTTPVGTYSITVTALADGTTASATFKVVAGASPITGVTGLTLAETTTVAATADVTPTVTFGGSSGHEYGTLKLYDQGTSTGTSTAGSYVTSTCTDGTFSAVSLTRGHYYYGVWTDSSEAYTNPNTYNVTATDFAKLTLPTFTATITTTGEVTLAHATITEFKGTVGIYADGATSSPVGSATFDGTGLVSTDPQLTLEASTAYDLYVVGDEAIYATTAHAKIDVITP